MTLTSSIALAEATGQLERQLLGGRRGRREVAREEDGADASGRGDSCRRESPSVMTLRVGAPFIPR